jgi:phage terminase Nu1 subunit (DNA packaging protein)
VGPSRVRLESVVFLYNRGSSAEQIVGEFPTLELADVHAVIAYYLRHKADVDAYIQRREAEADKLREQVEALPQNAELREKLTARRAQRG